MSESIGDFFAQLSIKLNQSSIPTLINEIKSELSKKGNVGIGVDGHFNVTQLQASLNTALKGLQKKSVEIKAIIKPVTDAVVKSTEPVVKAVKSAVGDEPEKAKTTRKSKKASKEPKPVRMSDAEYYDIIAKDRLLRKQEKSKKDSDNRLLKQRLEDERIIAQDNIRRDKAKQKYDEQQAKLLAKANKNNQRLSEIESKRLVRQSTKEEVERVRSENKARLDAIKQQKEAKLEEVRAERKLIAEKKSADKSEAAKQRLLDKSRKLDEKFVTYLRKQMIQVQQGGTLAPTQRAGGTDVLELMRNKLASGLTRVDSGFLDEYESVLKRQREIANTNKAARLERSDKSLLTKSIKDLDGGSFITRAKNITSRLDQMRAEKRLESNILSEVAKGKFGGDLEKAKSSDDFAKGIARLPTINATKLQQQIEALDSHLGRIRSSYKMNMDKLGQDYVNASTDADKEAIKRRMDSLTKANESILRQHRVLQSNLGEISARANELRNRQMKSSFSEALNGMRNAMTKMRDLSNNLVAPFIAMTGFQKANQVIGAFESSRVGLDAIASSAEEAADMYKHLDEEAIRLGMSMQDVGNPFVRLVASTEMSGIDSKVAKDLFTGVTQSAIKFNLDNQSVGRVIAALGQIASKGKVASEELEYRLAS